MPKNPQEFADLFGAELVGEVPDVAGGPLGMARLAHRLHQRLTPSQGERPGRPTDPEWAVRPKVPMSEATFDKLTALAAAMSTPERKVSPMQVAAQLLEEAVGLARPEAGRPGQAPDAEQDDRMERSHREPLAPGQPVPAGQEDGSLVDATHRGEAVKRQAEPKRNRRGQNHKGRQRGTQS